MNPYSSPPVQTERPLSVNPSRASHLFSGLRYFAIGLVAIGGVTVGPFVIESIGYSRWWILAPLLVTIFVVLSIMVIREKRPSRFEIPTGDSTNHQGTGNSQDLTALHPNDCEVP